MNKTIFKFFYLLLFLLSSCSLFESDNKTSSTTSFLFDKKIIVSPISESQFNLTPFIKLLLKNEGMYLYDIEGQYQNKAFSVNGALKIQNNNLNLITLINQNKLFNINLDSDLNFSTTTNIVEIKNNPEYLIGELCFIYLDKHDLSNLLPKDYKVEEFNNERSISYDDIPIIQITYDSNNHFVSNIEFNNVLKNYSYKLKKINFSNDEMWLINKIIYEQPDNLNRGLPLGNQSSQWFALYYLDTIDRLIKEKLKIKGYIRYMDDFILIHRDKKYLQYCLKEIENVCKKELDLELNKKTQIGVAYNGIDFLGFNHILTNSGKVIRKLRFSSMQRMKKHIKSIRKLKVKSIIDKDYINMRLNSFKAHLKHSNEKRMNKTISSLEKEVNLAEKI